MFFVDNERYFLKYYFLPPYRWMPRKLKHCTLSLGKFTEGLTKYWQLHESVLYRNKCRWNVILLETSVTDPDPCSMAFWIRNRCKQVKSPKTYYKRVPTGIDQYSIGSFLPLIQIFFNGSAVVKNVCFKTLDRVKKKSGFRSKFRFLAYSDPYKRIRIRNNDRNSIILTFKNDQLPIVNLLPAEGSKIRLPWEFSPVKKKTLTGHTDCNATRGER